jgi:uncharacterized protein (TIGR00725 family)
MRTVIGVMGSGRPLDAHAEQMARETGRRIAERGWVLLTGGHASGVMDAASRGASEAGGLVVGVLPEDGLDGCSRWVDVPVVTGLRDARNYVNALSSRVVVALPGAAGTISEVAFALKAGRTVVTVGWDLDGTFAEYAASGALLRVETPKDAVAAVASALDREGAL